MSVEVMARIWRRMGEMLGSRWSAFGAALVADAEGLPVQPPRLAPAAETWARELADVSVDRLAAGVHAVGRQGPEWWPTLGAFRALCMGGDLPEQRGPAYRREALTVPLLRDDRPVEVRRAERLARTSTARAALRAAARGAA